MNICILTTLKQPDLSAMSARQLFNNQSQKPNQIERINRFDLFEISGQFNLNILDTIQNTHIFYNPNKHHLVTSKTFFSNAHYYVQIKRKSPLNLTKKVSAMNALLSNPSDTVTHVFQSDVWEFKFNSPIDADQTLTDTIISSPNNIAPFAHPYIHDARPLQYADLCDWTLLFEPANHP